MRNLDMWQTINLAIRRAMDDQAHRLNEDKLGEQVDRLLLHQPTTGGKRLTTAYLLRRYRGALQRELCDGRRWDSPSTPGRSAPRSPCRPGG